MTDRIEFDGFAGAPPLYVSVDERPVSADESLSVLRVQVGRPDGYSATDLDAGTALALVACLVDKIRDVGPFLDVTEHLVAWALVLELADAGGGIEGAARRLGDRVIEAAVRMRDEARHD